MSNALAIATVTATVRGVLKDALTGINLPGATVTNLRPDATNLPEPCVNVFLYRVETNAALRHADLPTRRSDGTLLRRPQAAIDLHYLLTFHGDDNVEEPQRMLGAVIRRLHTEPVLQRADIHTYTDGQGQLAGTDLADQPELVRLVPDTATLDELSRLWTMFPETSYALSALYVASVVLIEADVPMPAPGVPVQRPVLQVVPLALPIIEAVAPQAVVDGSPAPTLTLSGRNLLAGMAGQTTVSFDGAAAVPIDPSSTPEQVVVAVPPGLAVGVHAVQVVRADPLGAPHVGSASNAAFFALRPQLAGINFAAATGQITAVLVPVPRAQQRIALLLNELPAANAPPGSFELAVEPRSQDNSPIVFAAGAVPTGTTYLVRAQVDGIESALTVAANGQITGPTLQLP